MKERNYHEQVIITNEINLKKQLEELPPFCKEFFLGLEPTTTSRTRIAYSYDLGIFFSYIYSQKLFPEYESVETYPLELLEKITPTIIEQFLSYLKYYVKNDMEYTNDERGQLRKLATLRSLYNYFFRKEKIFKNPAVLVKMPKVHEKNIIRLDVDEVARLLDQVESGEQLTQKQKQYHNLTKIRDLALLTLLLGTGIRVSECVGLDIDDIDFNNGGIKIKRKGGNEVIVYFGDEVEEALLDYLEERKKIIPETGNYNALFLSMQKKRIGVRAVELLVKKYAKLVTSLKTITPHKLRSTYGTNLYRETGDIYLVADVLGHKDVNTTKKHYAALEDERRRSAANVVKLREPRENNKEID